jgi:predicted metal-dependent RNase
MEALNQMDKSQLIDLLATLTSDYTKMITENNMNEDYEKCKLSIKAIQSEIEIRKNNINDISPEINITTLPDFS